MSQSVDTGAATTARAAYDAFGRGDIETDLGMCAEDISWNVPEPAPHAMSTTGRDGVGRFFGLLTELWSDFGIDVDLVTEEGDKAIAIGRAHGKLRGTESSYGWVHVFTVRDGEVVRFEEYFAQPEGGFPA